MLEAALRQAPLLRERVNEAKDKEKPDLVSITVHDGDSPLAHYSRHYREISFSRELLDAPIRRENIDKLVDVWMHEIEHARNGQYMAQFNGDFRVKVHALVNEPGPQDATALTRDYLQEGVGRKRWRNWPA